MIQRQRVEEAPAWVLHSHPWRETSLIVEAWTREHGRVGLVAKGARRPTSQFRGLLMGFQPLRLSWSGAGEVKTLVRAEWQGGQPMLQRQALLCAYYLNELLLRLTAREDPHPGLFDAYSDALASLGAGAALAPCLRRFEWRLLGELGYAPQLEHEAEHGAPLQDELRYAYIIERGPVVLAWEPEPPSAQSPQGESAPACSQPPPYPPARPGYSGAALRALSCGDFSSPATLREVKPLLRDLIHHQLGGQVLHARRVFLELNEL